MDTIYIVTYHTESGDEGVEGFWTEKPTDHHLETYFREHNEEEFDDGGRTIFWEVHELESIPLPKKAKKVTPSI
jgi:hypothetical protein